MCSLARAATLVAALILALAWKVPGRSVFQASQLKQPTGSISGRVTIGDKPASGVTVILAPGENNGPVLQPFTTKTTTDVEGFFQLTHISAGRYLVQTFTPAFVDPSSRDRWRPGKFINLTDGETVEGIDIALTRGGVITGRIADAEGQPVIDEQVGLLALDERGRKTPFHLPFSYCKSTDDRGVYRLFGVPPGRYIVSAGTDTTQPDTDSGNTYYALTYHPDVTDQSKAAIIEVTSGGEAAGIDITLGRAAKTFAVSGHMINADSGKPVAGMNYGYGSLLPNGNGLGSSTMTSSASNERGEFRLEGIMPGRYAAFAASMEQTDYYSDPLLFQITDADVTGLEIKVHRGSSLSGVVILEGDQIGAPKLSDMRIGVSVRSDSLIPPFSSAISIGPDGSFRAKGLRSGNVSFFLTTYPPPKGVSLLRVEPYGVEQPGVVVIAPGEQVTGVKVIFGYGTGIIRGQVNVEGGVLPEGFMLVVSIYHAGGKPVPVPGVVPDVRGRFAFEGLLPGDYDIVLSVAGDRPVRSGTMKQTVSVVNGAEAPVTMVIELGEKKQ